LGARDHPDLFVDAPGLSQIITTHRVNEYIYDGGINKRLLGDVCEVIGPHCVILGALRWGAALSQVDVTRYVELHQTQYEMIHFN
jgi:hypothetical protein